MGYFLILFLVLLLLSGCSTTPQPAAQTPARPVPNPSPTIAIPQPTVASPPDTPTPVAQQTQPPPRTVTPLPALPTVPQNPEIPSPPTATALAGATSTAQAGTVSHQASPPGGLGNTRSDLDLHYGSPDTIEVVQLTYQKGKVQVRVQGDPAQASSRAVNMDRFTGSPFGGPLPVSAAETLAKTLMPADAVFVRRYEPNDHQTVAVYTSARLAAVIDSFFFSGASGASVPPGTFDVIYTQNATGQIIKVTLAAGDNP